jgi:hypothetical protein
MTWSLKVKTFRNGTVWFIPHAEGNLIVSIGLLNIGMLVFTKIRICSYTTAIPVT